MVFYYYDNNNLTIQSGLLGGSGSFKLYANENNIKNTVEKSEDLPDDNSENDDDDNPNDEQTETTQTESKKSQDCQIKRKESLDQRANN
jgi:hypothetical protein